MWKVTESQDGSTSVYSEQFGAGYHSKYGALRESRHVFIESGLYYKVLGRKELTVLEIGFGSGLNTYLTWLEAERLALKIKYVAVEKHPVPEPIALAMNFPEKMNASRKNFESLHRAEWDCTNDLSPSFSLEKLKAPLETVAPTDKFDLIYFDAFPPSVQPELWEKHIFQKCSDWLLPNGILVTYCAKGNFKRALKSLGFEVETLTGPPGKREMVRAHKR